MNKSLLLSTFFISLLAFSHVGQCADYIEAHFRLKNVSFGSNPYMSPDGDGNVHVNINDLSMSVSDEYDYPSENRSSPDITTEYASTVLEVGVEYDLTITQEEIYGGSLEILDPGCGYSVTFRDNQGDPLSPANSGPDLPQVNGTYNFKLEINYSGTERIVFGKPDWQEMAEINLGGELGMYVASGSTNVTWSIKESNTGCQVVPIVNTSRAKFLAGDVPGAVTVLAEDQNGCKFEGMILVTSCESCSDGACDLGDYDDIFHTSSDLTIQSPISPGSNPPTKQQNFLATLGLGNDLDNRSAGDLIFAFDTSTSTNPSVDNFRIGKPLANINCVRFSNSTFQVLQINTISGLVDVRKSADNIVQVRIFRRVSGGFSKDSNGLFETPGSVYKKFEFIKGSDEIDLQVKEYLNTSLQNTFKYNNFDEAGGGGGIEVSDTETSAETMYWYSSPSTGTWVSNMLRHEGNTNSPSARILHEYTKYSGTGFDVYRLTKTTEGSGTETRENTFSYQSTEPFLLESVRRHNGGWEDYNYESSGSRRVTSIYSAWKDQTPTGTANLCKVTYFDYTGHSGDDGSQESRPRTITESILGKTVSKRFYIYTANSVTTVQHPDPNPTYSSSNTDNIVNSVTYATSGAFKGRITSQIHANETKVKVSRNESDTNYWYTEVSEEGKFNSGSGALEEGTIYRKNFNDYGGLKRQQTYNVVTVGGNLVSNLVDQVEFTLDDSNRPTAITHYDGTITSKSYDCCGLASQTDADGVVTSYNDAYPLRTTTMNYSSEGTITLQSTLNSVGNSIKEERSDGTTTITLSTATYNALGDIATSVNSLGGTTTYPFQTDSSLSVEVVPWSEGTVTNTRDYYADGSLEEVSGSGVNPMQQEWVVETISGKDRKVLKTTRVVGTNLNEVYRTVYDGAGRTIIQSRLSQDGTSNLETVTTYNSKNQRIKVVDPDGLPMIYEYDDLGDLEYETLDVDGNDVMNDAASSWDRITRYETVYDDYQHNGSGPTYIVEKQNVYSVIGSSSEVLMQQTIRTLDKPSTEIGFKQWTYVNGSSEPTEFEVEYQGSGVRMETTTFPDGTQDENKYVYSRLKETTRKDSSGAQLSKLTYSYDGFGRVTGVTDALNGLTTYTYNNADQVVTTTFPSVGMNPSLQTINTYDTTYGSGALTSVELTDGTDRYFKYDEKGQLIFEYGSQTYPVKYQYDDQGRRTKMWTYQAFSGNPASPGTGDETEWIFNQYNGNLEKKEYAIKNGDASGDFIEYTYTVGGRLKSRTFGGPTTSHPDLTTTYKYDFEMGGPNTKGGYLIMIDYPSGTDIELLTTTSGSTLGYNKLGQNTHVISNGVTTTRSYSPNGQLLSESYSGGRLNGFSVVNTYDSLNRRAAMELKEGSVVLKKTEFDYDPTAGRLTSVKDGLNYASYDYLANSSLIEHINYYDYSKLAMQATKDYDELNRLQSIKHSLVNGRNVDFTYTYNDAHQRDIMTREDGTYWDYDYDSLGQVSDAVPYWSDDTRVVGKQFEFDYDDIGNRTTSSKGGDSTGSYRRTTTYGDNNVNQITSLTLPGYTEVQGVAPEFGSVTVNSQSAERKGEYYRKEIATDSSSANLFTSVTVAATDLITTSGKIFTPESPITLEYDDYGNLTEDGRWKYEWSAENQLVKMYTRDEVVTDLSATSFQPQTIEFQYDELGRRISKDVYDGLFVQGQADPPLSSSTVFLYDGWNLIAEVDDSGASNEVIRTYTWGLDLSGSEQGAGGVGGLLMVHEDLNTHFVAMDGNGNVSALTDGATVTAEYEYGPFGEVLKVLGEIGNEMPIRFSSKYQDFETGLVYYGFRYYSPVLGRWINRDPISENGGINLYNFIKNSSIINYDILGLFTYFFEGPGWSNKKEKELYMASFKVRNRIRTALKEISSELSRKDCKHCGLDDPKGEIKVLLEGFQKILKKVEKGIGNTKRVNVYLETPLIVGGLPSNASWKVGFISSELVLDGTKFFASPTNTTGFNDLLHEFTHEYGTDDNVLPIYKDAHIIEIIYSQHVCFVIRAFK